MGAPLTCTPIAPDCDCDCVVLQVIPDSGRDAAGGSPADVAESLKQPLFSAETHHMAVLGCVHALVTRLPRVLPFARVVQVLMLTAGTGGIALSLVRNRPGEVKRLVSALLDMCGDEETGSWRQARCVGLLESVCDLAPHLTTTVRDTLVRRRLLPAVVVQLGFSVLDDFIEFVLGVV
jgi:hypothetical protein